MPHIAIASTTTLVPAIATFARHRVARPPGQAFAGCGLRRRHAQQPQHVAVESPPPLGCSTKILRALRAYARPSQEHILRVWFRDGLFAA